MPRHSSNAAPCGATDQRERSPAARVAGRRRRLLREHAIARLTTTLLAGGTLLGAAAGCSGDPTSVTITKPSADLHIVRRAPTAPALMKTSDSFYAVKGQDRELRLYYQPDAGSGASVGAEFLRLRVNANSLDRRPDGTPIATGDSVLITVTADPSLMSVDFQPSGLRFATGAPAELKLRYAECDGDYNGDGIIDSTDIALRSEIAIWSQESSTAPWTKLSTALLSTLDATTTLAGFTGYAVAY